MAQHFIYEIFGKKVGATQNILRRMSQQHVKEGEYRIIESHTNAKTCSIRERQLQEELGYVVDKIPYWKSLRNTKKKSQKQ